MSLSKNTISFSGIVGNDTLMQNMRSAICNQKVTHAYIIDGKQGMGKKKIASAFAKSLQCANSTKNGGNACCSCISCKTFDSLNNPDIIYVTPEKTKVIGVDDIRQQVVKNMETKPYLHRYKIFIIDNASEMTIAAQNALLKTLEEPVTYGVFLLLSKNARSFLPTVLSRAVLFKLKPIESSAVEQYIVNCTKASKEKSHFCAVYAQGNIGRAIEIATSEDFANMREKIISLISGITERDLVDGLLLVKQFDEMKEGIQECLDIASLWYRDMAVWIETENESLIFQQDIIEKLQKECETENLNLVLDKLNAILTAKHRLQQNSNFQLTMEVMLLELMRRNI